MALTEELIHQVHEFCLSEDNTLWEMGDIIAAAALSDEELNKLAELVQRKPSTLRQRERLSREFPPGKRDKRHAWGVYKELSRLPDPGDRQKLLDSRNEWTIEAMKQAVNLKLQAEAEKLGIGVPKGQMSSGMRVGNVVVKGELVKGQLKLTVASAVGEIKTFTLDNETIIACTIQA